MTITTPSGFDTACFAKRVLHRRFGNVVQRIDHCADVERGVAERKGFGNACEEVGLRGSGSGCSYGIHSRIDAGHACASRGKFPREIAGAATDIEDSKPRERWPRRPDHCQRALYGLHCSVPGFEAGRRQARWPKRYLISEVEAIFTDGIALSIDSHRRTDVP